MSETAHRVASTDDLADDGDRVIVEVDGREIAVFHVDGEYFALLNYCVHAAGPICEGEITGRVRQDPDGWLWEFDESAPVIACPWHQWAFDLATGRCVDSDRYSVPTYEVAVRDGDVFVYC